MSGNTKFSLNPAMQGFSFGVKRMNHLQIAREVRWAVWLTLFYILGWAGCAYFLPNQAGVLGFPLWFEIACIFVPLLFVVLISIVVKTVFKNIELESQE